MQKGLFKIQSNLQPVFDYTFFFRNNIGFPILISQYKSVLKGWLFDMEDRHGIFLREIRGCVWLINPKEKVIIVTLTEL